MAASTAFCAAALLATIAPDGAGSTRSLRLARGGVPPGAGAGGAAARGELGGGPLLGGREPVEVGLIGGDLLLQVRLLGGDLVEGGLRVGGSPGRIDLRGSGGLAGGGGHAEDVVLVAGDHVQRRDAGDELV